MSWFQLPYREARDGFWGEQTSTLNWCEEDYNITHYCAELVNTLTNLTFIWLGVSGIRDCMRFSHPSIFFVAFAGYIIVGMGSMAFHATLKYSMQLADELPMIYATCIIGYATFSFGKSRALQTVVGLSLFSLALFITVVYYITKDPVFHEVSYGVLTAAIVFRAMFIMKYQLHPALELRSTDRAAAIMSQMWKMCFTGIGMFLLGFLIWNLDNVYCSHLLSWRQILLLPWSLVLEGHGWWHLFTGLAYYFIAWRIWLHRCLEGKEDEYMLQWPSPYTSVPRVVPIYEGDNGKDRKIL
ncbi:alkaline dihydroceramidase [Grosmannia clavigera kw1407]|uniref:Alkaline dihydroceramidase n=1 Tax=Grosmannia clavigera (strain kw1407 / UAMH 11150) TaxID=655863 RepID=F0XMI3_GROCL|nr:alkaline dihydroceramidase [Grosmannia clavigera kw1407]EFX01210.1 alkaline dihydroceramidase [Grosmannia clavigera kw1407]